MINATTGKTIPPTVLEEYPNLTKIMHVDRDI